MQQAQAEKLARTLMMKHGASHFSFRWMRAKTTCGKVTFYGDGSIGILYLSSYYVTHATDEAIEETILHEIAHILAGAKEGHSAKWRRIALSIGSNGKRCGDFNEEMPNKPRAPWIGKCNGCGNETAGFHRAPLRVRFCGPCGNGTIKPEFAYVWRKNGFKVPITQMPDRFRAEAMRMRIRWGSRFPI